jgi:hypothetical protein
MRTSVARLAKGFGQLATIRGTTKYQISPFEQRALAGIISKGIPNTIWRFKYSFLDVVPRKFAIYSYNFESDAEGARFYDCFLVCCDVTQYVLLKRLQGTTVYVV